MKIRLIVIGVAAIAVALAPAGRTSAAAPTSGPTVCTWGGTPAAPTGVITFSPGVTNTPSTGPIGFVATGPLAGGDGCSGTLTFRGTLAPGDTCAVATPFEAIAEGFPPVHRARSSFGPAGTAPVALYDEHGAIVGSEQAQFLSGIANPDNPLYMSCGNPGGLTQAHWSDTLELFESAHRW